MEQIHRIIKVGNSLAVVLPRRVARAMKWARGDLVIFVVTSDEGIYIKRLDDKAIQELKFSTIQNG